MREAATGEPNSHSVNRMNDFLVAFAEAVVVVVVAVVVVVVVVVVMRMVMMVMR